MGSVNNNLSPIGPHDQSSPAPVKSSLRTNNPSVLPTKKKVRFQLDNEEQIESQDNEEQIESQDNEEQIGSPLNKGVITRGFEGIGVVAGGIRHAGAFLIQSSGDAIKSLGDGIISIGKGFRVGLKKSEINELCVVAKELNEKAGLSFNKDILQNHLEYMVYNDEELPDPNDKSAMDAFLSKVEPSADGSSYSDPDEPAVGPPMQSKIQAKKWEIGRATGLGALFGRAIDGIGSAIDSAGTAIKMHIKRAGEDLRVRRADIKVGWHQKTIGDLVNKAEENYNKMENEEGNSSPFDKDHFRGQLKEMVRHGDPLPDEDNIGEYVDKWINNESFVKVEEDEIKDDEMIEDDNDNNALSLAPAQDAEPSPAPAKDEARSPASPAPSTSVMSSVPSGVSPSALSSILPPKVGKYTNNGATSSLEITIGDKKIMLSADFTGRPKWTDDDKKNHFQKMVDKAALLAVGYDLGGKTNKLVLHPGDPVKLDRSFTSSKPGMGVRTWGKDEVPLLDRVSKTLRNIGTETDLKKLRKEALEKLKNILLDEKEEDGGPAITLSTFEADPDSN